MSTKEQYQSHQETILQAERSLVLFNDHENTFVVIDVLYTVVFLRNKQNNAPGLLTTRQVSGNDRRY